tara:strand:+ start:275 stop:1051 length:777 start_codon:yes stop_codon:yes gene_type:complete
MEVQLKQNGYVVIPNILNDEELEISTKLFKDWYKSNIGPTCIIKDKQVGHQEHAWYIRTRPSVINIFKDLWKTNDLICSFDGCCYMSKSHNYNHYWTHVDQSPKHTDFMCYQGFVSLTSNSKKTLVVYKGSHLLYDSYVKQYNLNSDKNFHIIHEEFLKENTKTIVEVEKGSLVLWDSRLFHQNQCGEINDEERFVQYVCYMPRSYNTPENIIRRKYAFDNKITSTHWPIPIRYSSNNITTNDLFDTKPYIESMLKLL